ncbi:MAG TPA: alpha-hydroxy acid oxidase [Hyphomicrobiaceae bacterium]|nr:alpha-hydroxy acid oxidase [Hyphomicrobiaceae bacterium]
MPWTLDRTTSRRRFLGFLAASPLISAGGLSALAQTPSSPHRLPDPMLWAPRDLENLIVSPKEAINIFDFEPVARKNVPPAHFGYMVAGVDDEVTLRANREGFLKFQLRPRRLVDVSKIDMRSTILGVAYDSPIFICPTASNRAFHPDGEVAVAKAARSGNHLQMLSTVATTSIEEASAARGAPIWFQLYASPRWQIAEALAKRAERAGCPAIVVTIDDLGGRNQETLQRLRRTDTRQCSACHAPGWGYVARKPNYDGLDMSGLSTVLSPNMTWDFIKRLRDTVATKLLLKGIMSHEDARLAAASGIDAIIVSNHGGRSEDSGRSTIDALPEIIEAAGDTMPVLVDSGFRRGTDILKALALGAKGVGIGRPCLWGLGAFGQEGVERVLELLRAELRVAMQQVGAPSIRDLTPAMVRRA